MIKVKTLQIQPNSYIRNSNNLYSLNGIQQNCSWVNFAKILESKENNQKLPKFKSIEMYQVMTNF